MSSYSLPVNYASADTTALLFRMVRERGIVQNQVYIWRHNVNKKFSIEINHWIVKYIALKRTWKFVSFLIYSI